MNLNYMVDLLNQQGLHPTRSKNGLYRSFCPVCHRTGKRPTLTVYPENAKYGTFLKCFRGCDWLDIKQALNIDSTPSIEISHEVNHEQKEAERKQAAEGAAKLAAEWWQKASKADPSHFYLKRKKIPPVGIRQLGGMLLVPLFRNGELRSVQMIQREPEKAYLRGTDKAGCYMTLGRPNGVIFLCEGYATTVSVYLATHGGTVCAFDAGNLPTIARLMCKKFPTSRIVLCADDDKAGLDAVNEVATEIHASIAIPQFPANRGPKDSDFNDLMLLCGIEEVRKQLSEVLETERKPAF